MLFGAALRRSRALFWCAIASPDLHPIFALALSALVWGWKRHSSHALQATSPRPPTPLQPSSCWGGELALSVGTLPKGPGWVSLRACLTDLTLQSLAASRLVVLTGTCFGLWSRCRWQTIGAIAAACKLRI